MNSLKEASLKLGNMDHSTAVKCGYSENNPREASASQRAGTGEGGTGLLSVAGTLCADSLS